MKGKHFKEAKHAYCGTKISNRAVKVNNIGKLAIILEIVLFNLLCSLTTTYGKYVINKEIVINVSTADYYFTASAREEEIYSAGEVIVYIDTSNFVKETIDNKEVEKITEVDVGYTIKAENEKYNITLERQVEGESEEIEETDEIILEGKGESEEAVKRIETIRMIAEPKQNVELGTVETITVTIKTTKPYVEEKNIEITIKDPHITVTLNTNGGTINSGDITEYIKGVGATLPTNVTNGDKVFYGWYDNKECIGNPITEITAEDTGEKIYWAKWVSYVLEGTGTGTRTEVDKYSDITGGYNYVYNGQTSANGWSVGDNGDYYYQITASFAGNYISFFTEEKIDLTNVKEIELQYSTCVNYTNGLTNTVYLAVSDNKNASITDANSINRVHSGLVGSNNGKKELKNESIDDSDCTPIQKLKLDVSNLSGKKYIKITLLHGNEASAHTSFMRIYSIKLKNTLSPKHQVTLNTNGGTINSGGITEYIEEVGAILPTNITNEDKVFCGWYNNKECIGNPITEITAEDTGEKIYWAKWISYILKGKGIWTGTEVDKYSDITGGYNYVYKEQTSANGWSVGDNGDYYYQITASFAGNYISFFTEEKIDLTNVKEIELQYSTCVNYTNGLTNTVYLAVSDNKNASITDANSINRVHSGLIGSNNGKKELQKQSIGDSDCTPIQKLKLDVSNLSGKKYIKITLLHGNEASANTSFVRIYSIKLKSTLGTPKSEYIVSEAGDYICEIGGRIYYKTNGGEAIAAMMHYRHTDNNLYKAPLLVSTDRNAVTYHTTNDELSHTSSGCFTYNGTTYYYSSMGHWRYANTSCSYKVLLNGENMPYTSMEDAAKALLGAYYGT